MLFAIKHLLEALQRWQTLSTLSKVYEPVRRKQSQVLKGALFHKAFIEA